MCREKGGKKVERYVKDEDWCSLDTAPAKEASGSCGPLHLVS